MRPKLEDVHKKPSKLGFEKDDERQQQTVHFPRRTLPRKEQRAQAPLECYIWPNMNGSFNACELKTAHTFSALAVAKI